jgi:YegS/Rv2252/BmrU family lipid kinase
MSAALIINPTANKGKSAALTDKLCKGLESRGVECQPYVTEKPGDATAFARKAAEGGAQTVIAVGGDGTVNEVINGIAGTGVCLGMLPAGTVNVCARELGIPFNIKKAIDVIAEGRIKHIDLGMANERYFVLMAGLGFDAEVVSHVFRPVKDILGSSAYVLKGLETLARYSATEVTLEMPEETYKASAFLVIVANFSTYTYNLKIAPYASPESGFLDICVFECSVLEKLKFIQHIADVFLKRHLLNDEVKYFRTARVKITSSPKIMAQLDGDAFMTTPVEITAAPHILPVIVPGDK